MLNETLQLRKTILVTFILEACAEYKTLLSTQVCNSIARVCFANGQKVREKARKYFRLKKDSPEQFHRRLETAREDLRRLYSNTPPLDSMENGKKELPEVANFRLEYTLKKIGELSQEGGRELNEFHAKLLDKKEDEANIAAEIEKLQAKEAKIKEDIKYSLEHIQEIESKLKRLDRKRKATESEQDKILEVLEAKYATLEVDY